MITLPGNLDIKRNSVFLLFILALIFPAAMVNAGVVTFRESHGMQGEDSSDSTYLVQSQEQLKIFEDLLIGSKVVVFLKNGNKLKGWIHQFGEEYIQLRCEKNAGFGKVKSDYPTVKTSEILRIEAQKSSWFNAGWILGPAIIIVMMYVVPLILSSGS